MLGYGRACNMLCVKGSILERTRAELGLIQRHGKSLSCTIPWEYCALTGRDMVLSDL
jgi:hypothetical protein